MADKPDLAAGIPAADLAPGRPVTGTFEGADILLARQDDGTIAALSASCTHLGAPLGDGIVVDGQVRCPWHHARFALDTGEAVAGPAIAPLGCYAVEQVDGRIRVTGRRESAGGGANGEEPDTALTVDAPVVIIGSGAAGHALADHLARAGHGGDVLILSADAGPFYDRTFVSKQYLAGQKTRGESLLPPPGKGHGSTPITRFATRVTRIDRATRRVVTESGETIGYGTLVLATGADPVRPEFDGSSHAHVHTLRSLADADALIAAARGAANAVVLGSSFVGLEVAASLRARDIAVAVVDRGDVPLEPVLGTAVGEFVRGLHEDEGVAFHLGRTIARYDGATVTLDDGTALPADLLVVGAGVRPRIDLAAEAGLALAGDANGVRTAGVRVDGHLRTSDPAIYAIGDIASYPDLRLGRSIRVEHWAHAQRQGAYLARRMTGADAAGFGDTPFFWSGHYGTQLRYVGHASPDASRIEGDIAAGEFAIYFQDDGADRALLACGRDALALRVEADWDQPASA